MNTRMIRIGELNEAGLKMVDALVTALLLMPDFVEPVKDRHPQLIVSRPAQEKTFITRCREPFFVIDKTMSVVCVSRALQDILGNSASELLGNRWENVLDGAEELRLAQQKLLIAAQTHQPFTHSARCRAKDGHLVFLYMDVKPHFPPPECHFEGYIGVARVLPFPLTIIASDDDLKEATG